MTHRERMLAAVRGQRVDQIPWAPRMDLWFIACRERGTLPSGWQELNTVEVAGRLGVAVHAVRGDRTRPGREEHQIMRGLGLDSHPDFPFSFRFSDVTVEHHQDTENSITTFRTTAGETTVHWRTTADMRKRGISLPFVQSYAISEPGDMEVVGDLFERIEVIPTPRDYAAFQRRIGDHGLAVAAGPVSASPMHLILHELMPMEQFFYAYSDHRERLETLARRMEPVYRAILDAVLACDAEVVSWGGNYDQDITWPPFFVQEIAPWLREVSDKLHQAGKALQTHTDGENQALLPLYADCRFDVAESLCPAPMTRLSLSELRHGFGPEVTVWGGVPSVILIEAVTDRRRFERWLQGLAEELDRDPRRIIVGVSDNVPPDASLDRLAQVGACVAGVAPPQ